MKQVVAALIVRKSKNEDADEILICQRTETQPLPLKWEFPGGKIEPGEQPAEALARELEEELGIRAKIGAKVASLQHHYASGTHVELHFFLVKEFQGEIENKIFRDVRWVPLIGLPGYDFLEADLGLVKDISSGKLL
jgi:8-oxo-dGTP diphosphatase